jgi:transcriptional regulator with XRE-family HTH domain
MACASEHEPLTLEQALGQVIRVLRKDKGLKQVEVAVATGFAATTLRKMESGRQSMTIRSLDALATFYGVPIEELIIRAKKLRRGSL